jgi:tetratricopeptide (TPR) repeat protein
MKRLNIKIIALAFGLTIIHPPLPLTCASFISSVHAQSATSRNEADRLLTQGDQQADQGKAQDALETYKRAQAIYKSIKNRSGEGRSINRISLIYLYDLKDIETARTHLNQALSIAQSIPDFLLESKALLNLGTSHKMREEYQSAIAYHRQSVAAAIKAKNCEVEKAALAALGYDYLTLDPKQSIQVLEETQKSYPSCKGSDAAEELSIRKEESELLTNLGQFYTALSTQSWLKNPLGKSTQVYQQSLVITRQIGDHKQASITLSRLADIYTTQGNYPEAQTVLEEAIENLKQLPNTDFLLVEALSKLVNVYNYETIKRWDKALNAGEQALKILSLPPKEAEGQLEYKGYESGVLLSMGDAYRNQEKYPEAIEKYRAAAAAAGVALTSANQLRTNPNWIYVQRNKALLLQRTACSQLKLVYARSGQPDRSSDICQNK